MAITINSPQISAGTANATSKTLNFATQPTAGNIIFAVGGCHNIASANTLSFSAPSGLNIQQDGDGTGSNIAGHLADKTASGSEGDAVTIAVASAKPLALFCAHLSGAGELTTSGKTGPTDLAQKTITATASGAVAVDGSLAVFVCLRRGRAETVTDVAYGNGFAELAKAQVTTDSQTEIYVATKEVNVSDGTVSSSWTTTAFSGANLYAFIAVYPPAAAEAPTVTMVSPPGNQSIFEGDTVVLEASATGGSTPYKNWSWSVVEGSSGTTPVTTQNGSMVFPNDGTWTLRLTVDGDDDETSDPVDRTITVSVIPNEPPIITSNGGGATAEISVVEGQTAVTTVVASDADDDAITYIISGGADDDHFSIDAETGVLTFDVAPVFATPTDANTDNVYVVEVTASDGTDTDTQTISVTVTEAPEVVVGAGTRYTWLLRRRRRQSD